MAVLFVPGWAFCGPALDLLPLPRSWRRPPSGLAAGELASWLAAACVPGPDGRGRDVCVAWSLGALAALEFCRRHPGRLAALVVVGARRSWPAAELAEIDTRFAEHPRPFLDDFYRKCLLGHRQAWKRLARGLPAGFPGQDTARRLRQDLALLARSEEVFHPWVADACRHAVPRLVCLHGGRDVIAPVAEMVCLAGAERLLLPAEGHAAFLAGEAQARIAALAQGA